MFCRRIWSKTWERLPSLKIQILAGVKWHRLIPINDRVPADSTIEQRVAGFKDIVQQTYLDNMNLSFDGILAYSSFSFMPISQMAKQHAEQPLGNLISDAYIYAIRQAEGDNYQPVDVAIVPNGTIRASLVKGDITVSDVLMSVLWEQVRIKSLVIR